MEVIEADRRFIKQAHKDVESQAQKMLEQGMETQVQDLGDTQHRHRARVGLLVHGL